MNAWENKSWDSLTVELREQTAAPSDAAPEAAAPSAEERVRSHGSSSYEARQRARTREGAVERGIDLLWSKWLYISLCWDRLMQTILV